MYLHLYSALFLIFTSSPSFTCYEFGTFCILTWCLSKPKIVSNVTVSHHVYVPVAMCCVIEFCVCTWYDLDHRRNHIDFGIAARHRTQSSYQPAVMHETPKTKTCDNTFQFTSLIDCNVKKHGNDQTWDRFSGLYLKIRKLSEKICKNINVLNLQLVACKYSIFINEADPSLLSGSMFGVFKKMTSDIE